MRYIGIIGQGALDTQMLISELQHEKPTQPVLLRNTGSKLIFSGYVFCHRRWYIDIDAHSYGRTEQIDEFLKFLVDSSVDDSNSKNLRLIRDYLNNKPNSVNDCIVKWEALFDGSFNSI